MRPTLAISLISTTILTALPAGPALAQEAAAAVQESSSAPAPEDRTGGEIIVTARQRGERLIDVPVAVTALDSADLERYGAKSLSDIAQLAPQVIAAKQASGGGSSFVIRGIGSSTLDTGFDQSVAINVDGVQTSRGRSLHQSYFEGKAAVTDELIAKQVHGALVPEKMHFAKRWKVMCADDERVVVIMEGGGPTLSGDDYDQTYCEIFRFKDGKVIEMHAFLDTALVERALFDNPLTTERGPVAKPLTY